MSGAAKSVGRAASNVAQAVAKPIITPIVKPIEAAVDLAKGRTTLGDALKKTALAQLSPIVENPGLLAQKQIARNVNTVTEKYENLAKRYGTVGKVVGGVIGGPTYAAGKVSQAGTKYLTELGNRSGVNAEFKKAGVESPLDIDNRGVSNPFSDLPVASETPVSLENAKYNAEQELIAAKTKAIEDERAAEIARGRIGRQQSVLTSRKRMSKTGLSRSLTGLASR